MVDMADNLIFTVERVIDTPGVSIGHQIAC